MLFVEHVVLLKTKRTPSAEELDGLQKLCGIRGVAWVSAGPNYTKRGLGYNFAVVVRLTGKEAEEAYQTHPLHVEVRDTIIKPLLDTEQPNPILAIDYEHNQRPKWAAMGVGFVAGILAVTLLRVVRTKM